MYTHCRSIQTMLNILTSFLRMHASKLSSSPLFHGFYLKKRVEVNATKLSQDTDHSPKISSTFQFLLQMLSDQIQPHAYAVL